MRDRLIELVSKAREKCNLTSCCDCEYRDSETLTNCYSYLIADHLLANGVIVPPCKVGDTVWFVRDGKRDGKIEETTVEKIVLKGKGIYIKLACNAMYETSCNSIGKTVFLTREEAELALKGDTNV